MVEENFKWTYGQSSDPNGIARTKALVEDCLSHAFTDRDEARNISVPLEVVARAICRLFNGDIRKRKIRHFCRAGCCMDRASRQSTRVSLCVVILLFPYASSEHIISNTFKRGSLGLTNPVMCPYGRRSADTICRPNASLTSRTSLSRSLNTMSKHQHLIVGCLYIPWSACFHYSSTSMACILQQRGILVVT